ncbi:alginate lyase family protein [Pseudoalteromonas sp. JC3]|uniref:alginate lyase family protein n=1 Tax=Pseudoalteromonas sp. JC3 TaxID=2810196 RepID=UPI0019CFE8EF|nr:alginate lyase family protein [Pseudoalteromonas sp. JC3]MBR8841769.1 alginate lyase family protein [Pseudoalteromonas sp. JC3]WJE11233.1 alginate lyase family protein [Pseudoalteromonas sp. JC3]
MKENLKVITNLSISKLIFNYRKKVRGVVENLEIESDANLHKYFVHLKSKYQEALLQANKADLHSLAEQAMEQGVISISEKAILPPSGCDRDYLSFAPYYYVNENTNPLTKSRETVQHRDSRSNPFLASISDKPKLAQVCARLHAVSLSYRDTPSNDKIEFIESQIKTWFINENTAMTPHMEFAQIMPWTGNKYGLGIIDSRWLLLAIEACALVVDKLTLETLHGFKVWLREFAKWILSSKSGLTEVARKNNRGSWVDVLLAYILLFLNEERCVALIVDHTLKNRFEIQFDNNGDQPFELTRYNPVSYSLYNYYPIKYILQIDELINSQGNREKKITMNKTISRLEAAITCHERGSIEHIDFKLSKNLNLYYPYSFAQIATFPAVMPLTSNAKTPVPNKSNTPAKSIVSS